MLDARLARSLHVESLRSRDLHPEHEPHVLFQASTIGALLDGAYDGDVSFAQLAEHGDLGLGTFNALDGEMIAVDGALLPRRRGRPTATVDPGDAHAVRCGHVVRAGRIGRDRRAARPRRSAG